MKRLTWLLLAVPLAAGAAGPTLEQLLADPKTWPGEVTVTTATRATVLRQGRPAGVMLVGAGRKLVPTAIAADGITGKIGSDTVKVPLEKTNLLTGDDGVAAPLAPTATPDAAVATTPAASVSGISAISAKDGIQERNGALRDVLEDPVGAPTAMQRLFDGKLVRYAGARLEPANLGAARFVAIYYSASWCGPCRQFTPELVKAYRELKQQHPEFEVVFVSADRSAIDMLGYMREDAMPWPAVRYERREQPMLAYAGPGIPCLVLVDATGKVLADSYRGDDYLGPQHVLAQTRRILALVR